MVAAAGVNNQTGDRIARFQGLEHHIAALDAAVQVGEARRHDRHVLQALPLAAASRVDADEHFGAGGVLFEGPGDGMVHAVEEQVPTRAAGHVE